jgi:hypothetical protein
MADRIMEFKLLASKGAKDRIDIDIIVDSFRIIQASLTSQESLDAWIEASTVEISSLIRSQLMDLVREVK